MRPRSFYFHYNKPASLSAGEVRLSVHFDDRCLVVGAVECHVPVRSKNRKRQPRCVMAGKARSVSITNNTAVIQ